jgi:hypothetical protein
MQKKSKPIVIRSGHSSEYVGNMLNIEDDIPLQELIEKLK